MLLAQAVSDHPSRPAVYALFGGSGPNRYVAYVGVADDLRRRSRQHLINHDSSITTGSKAVSLNPDLVTEVDWWEHPEFAQAGMLATAEIVAFEILNPALRSRGAVQKLAKKNLSENTAIVDEFRLLFAGPPTGRLVRSSLQVALVRIAELEHRVAELERRLTAKK